MTKLTHRFVVGEKAGPFVTGDELGKIVCAHYGLDDRPIAEVSVVMRPQELAEVIITMFIDSQLLVTLRTEANQE